MEIKATFAPVLYIKSGITDVSFYEKAFGAVENHRWADDNGAIHVVEFSIGGTLFHLHEENLEKGCFSPAVHGGITTIIGLFVDDPHAVAAQAIAAGATELSPVQDYDYGYRQGDIADPFGHRWCLQKKLFSLHGEH